MRHYSRTKRSKLTMGLVTLSVKFSYMCSVFLWHILETGPMTYNKSSPCYGSGKICLSLPHTPDMDKLYIVNRQVDSSAIFTTEKVFRECVRYSQIHSNKARDTPDELCSILQVRGLIRHSDTPLKCTPILIEVWSLLYEVWADLDSWKFRICIEIMIHPNDPKHNLKLS